MRKIAEASIPMRAMLATVRFSFPWGIGSADVPRRLELFGELIIGVIVDTMVLALGIFGLITAACIALL
jgi:hypothetical protein